MGAGVGEERREVEGEASAEGSVVGGSVAEGSVGERVRGRGKKEVNVVMAVGWQAVGAELGAGEEVVGVMGVKAGVREVVEGFVWQLGEVFPEDDPIGCASKQRAQQAVPKLGLLSLAGGGGFAVAV